MEELLLFTVILTSTALCERIKLNFHPAPDEPFSTLIWYNKTSYESWTNKLDNYLEPYRTPELTPGRAENLAKCDHSSAEKVCYVNVESFSPCVSTNYFGFKKSSPCIFIDFNKVVDWKPSYFDDINSLPKAMPKNLKDYIDEKTVDPNQWETIWMSCDGETPADKELIGPVTYIPYPGFPGYFFPFQNQEGYLSPVTAVHFQKPQMGVVINVECKTWTPEAHNNHTLASARFQLLID